ncbi:MAG: YceI family protein [Myxococcota bacterium]|nr:YceI family protein [Myxococcota bacterium]
MLSLILLALACTPAESTAPAGDQAPSAEAGKEAEPKAAPQQPLTVRGGQLQLVQIKNGSAEVGATVDAPTGQIAFSGKPSELSIPVSTWNSGMELRDQRLHDTFFHAGEHPNATWTVTFPEMPALEQGASTTLPLSGEVAFYTGKAPVSFEATLTRTGETTYTLASKAPFEVSIAAAGLGENLQALITECAHESIGDAVKVSGSLELIAE